MREFFAGEFDIAVIGAGHAGIEAALAAARLGMRTVCFTIDLDAVGNMPCNPAIGGTGKGHLVRELDALGGEMARAADRACIQYRMLNRAKGPAVWSLRAQADRRLYQQVMKHTLERQENLTLRQAEVTELRCEDGHVSAVVLRTGAVFRVGAAILCTGTYLTGRTIVGECIESSGPDGMHAANALTDSLLALGLPLRRFKTGTPPRVNRRSIDFSQMEVQVGDDDPLPFSFDTAQTPENRAVCYLTYTNAETHRIIRENLDRSPIYSGVIEGVGPRYCAGQFNGSSGYEEAAVQGFVAGVNAALALKGEPPLLLKRSESYIGTLIDDLVTKGTEEPYRMMTSRSEYRLLLRQDNADRRLCAIGHRIGLVSAERLRAVEEKYAAVEQEVKRLTHTGVAGSDALNALLMQRGTAPVADGARLIDLLRRPQVSYDDLRPFDPGAPALDKAVREQVEITVKYEGYIRRQQRQVEEFEQLEKHALPDDVDYSDIQGLRLEAREKLSAVRPLNLGQASRISGVSPADIGALMIWLQSRRG